MEFMGCDSVALNVRASDWAKAGEQEEGTRRTDSCRSPSIPAEPSRASHPNYPDGLCPDVGAVSRDSANAAVSSEELSPFADPDGSAETPLGVHIPAMLGYLNRVRDGNRSFFDSVFYVSICSIIT